MDFTILSTKQDYLRMRGVVTNFARAAIETSSFFFFFFLFVCLFVFAFRLLRDLFTCGRRHASLTSLLSSCRGINSQSVFCMRFEDRVQQFGKIEPRTHFF